MSNKISIKDVYEIIDHKTEVIQVEIRSMRKDMNEKFEKYGTRITFLEHWKANITGKMAIVFGVSSVIVTSVWTYIWSKIKGD